MLLEGGDVLVEVEQALHRDLDLVVRQVGEHRPRQVSLSPQLRPDEQKKGESLRRHRIHNNPLPRLQVKVPILA